MERVISFETAQLIPSDYDGESVAAYTKEGYIYPKSYLYSMQPGESFPCVRYDTLVAWLRENHGIWVSVYDDYHMSKNIPCISYKVTTYGNAKEHCGYSKEIHQGLPYKYLKPEDYHKVLEAGLFKALEILKTRQHEKDNSSNGKV